MLRKHIKRLVKDNMKKTSLQGYVYGFRVHYEAIAVSDLLDIHEDLMEKNKMITV